MFDGISLWRSLILVVLIFLVAYLFSPQEEDESDRTDRD